MDLRDNNPQKKWKNREFTTSFEFALTGIIMAVKEERNMRKHLVSAILVVLAGLVFRVSAIEWIFLLQAVFLVIALEIVNSAMENVVDLASNYHFSMLAKKAHCKLYDIPGIISNEYRSCANVFSLFFRSLIKVSLV